MIPTVERFRIGDARIDAPLWIVGPDVIEDRSFTVDVAARIAAVFAQRKLPFVFKASFEKANRSSTSSFRGPGIDEGLAVLAEIRESLGVPVTTDVHDIGQVEAVAEVADVIQIPAFLSRQNALLERVAETGRVVNLKKGQFLSPWDIESRVGVLRSAGAEEPWITERGVSFGYQRLVNDFRVVPEAKKCGAALIFDATHSVQTPGGLGGRSGGERPYIPVLARAAAAAGCDGFFFEVHPDPARALCDGPNALPLDRLGDIIDHIGRIASVVRELDEIELEP